MLLAQKANNPAQRLGFHRVEAGGRLVQTDHLRTGAHGAGDLQPPLLSVGEGPRQTVGAVHHLHHLQPVKSAIQRLTLRLPIPTGIEDPGQQMAVDLGMLGHQQVLDHRHLAE